MYFPAIQHLKFLCPALLAGGLLVSVVSAAEVSYRNDVQAVVAKAGCNLGTCHGNATGKGGFKMSLRGDDLEYDYLAMVEDASGRRVDMMQPDRSLLLQKATQAVAHEGGKRFEKDSWEYGVLRDWIAQGATRDGEESAKLVKLDVTPRKQILVEPEESVQIKAVATFSDGTQKDVTPHAVYEPAQVGLVEVSRDGKVKKLKTGEPTVIVRYLNLQQPVELTFVPARPEFVWQPTRQNNFIDRHVFAKLKALRMNPSELAGDGVYIRRLHLDLLGIPPTAEEAQAFISDKNPAKRELAVEKLMARTEFADFWALKWADALRVESRTMDRKGMTLFHAWIRDAVARNTPVDEFTAAILGAQGSTYDVPETNFYRAMREPNARAEGIARIFLGTRLQCAQCHNHPFDKWTQDDYFNWSAVFSRVDYKLLEKDGTDQNDPHLFRGEQVVQVSASKKLQNPRIGAPATARFLGGNNLDEKILSERQELKAAAAWITSSKNQLFAEAQVNRIWAHLMGRGIVDPVDDFRATNPASHPELLAELATEFRESGYDMRHIIRLIVNSRTWQLSSEPNETNSGDEVNFSHVMVRRLSAEQLFDAMHQFAGVRPEFTEFPEVVRASQIPGPLHQRRSAGGPSESLLFLRQFGQPPRMLACECERTDETSMGQAFSLISSPQVNGLLRRGGNALQKLTASGRTDEQMVDDLCWSALGRGPTEEERRAFTGLLHASGDKRAAVEDLAWSLVNAKAFVLRY